METYLVMHIHYASWCWRAKVAWYKSLNASLFRCLGQGYLITQAREYYARYYYINAFNGFNKVILRTGQVCSYDANAAAFEFIVSLAIDRCRSCKNGNILRTLVSQLEMNHCMRY